MNDFQFASRVSSRIGELYAEAKNSRRLFPEYALARLRGLASLCCDMLRQGEVQQWPKGLEEKIALLVRSHHINAQTREQLDSLRRWGNSASHPEESRIDSSDLPRLVDDALELARGLLKTTFYKQHSCTTLPAYEVVAELREDLKDVCYRALLQHNAEDQYKVALLLRREVNEKVKQAQSSSNPFLEQYKIRFEIEKIEEQALDLLRYASANYIPAQYAYGVSLAEGQRGENMVAMGVNQIFLACREGDTNALAWCGQASLLGLHDEPVDYARARDLLEQAAAEDHPVALSLLSQMYRNGLGIPVDMPCAFQLTLRAAQAGYPLAQYEAAEALSEGNGTQRDERGAHAWLRKASQAGLPEALLAEARLIRRGVLPGGLKDVEPLLQRAREKLNEARFELADLYISSDEPKKWIEAIALIQSVYEFALAEKAEVLANRCRAVAPSWVKKVESLRGGHDLARLSDDDFSNLVLTRFLFDEYGRPYPDRQQRLREFGNRAMAIHRQKGSGELIKDSSIRKLASGMGSVQPAVGRHIALSPVVTQRISPRKIGRNATCACGSGKKYKVCCA